jgi:hypothetical protein
MIDPNDRRHSAMDAPSEVSGVGPETISPEAVRLGEEGQARIDRMVEILVEHNRETPVEQLGGADYAA